MGYDTESAKISSIKTYMLVAWVFSIIVVASLIMLFIYFVALFIFVGLLGVPSGVVPFPDRLAATASRALVYGIILLVFLIPSILVMRRVGRLYHAAKRADIQTLKANNSLGWAIIALIFTGIIPGIMLLLTHGPINELQIKTGSIGSIIGTDALDKLERLKKLLDAGVINKDEFETQKKRIMGPITQSMNTPEEELVKLKQLLDSGAITKTEYEEQKKRVLSKI